MPNILKIEYLVNYYYYLRNSLEEKSIQVARFLSRMQQLQESECLTWRCSEGLDTTLGRAKWVMLLLLSHWTI